MFVLRPARIDDLPAIARLARVLDTVNLPDDPHALDDILHTSIASFAGTAPMPEAAYLFVLHNTLDDAIAGCSMIIAEHGNTRTPHHYFRVDLDERHSHTLNELFRHQTLTFRQSFSPHTELGALVLHPDYRGDPRRLGSLLSLGRLLFIAAHRNRFHESIQAELLPPLEPNGTSRLWEWLGRRFTGLTYQQADRLSRTNHEFMKALFPHTPLYTSLMPPDVQAIIGAVGPQTEGVRHMLTRQGFRYNQHIDPFDGGPHYEARTPDVPIVAQCRQVSCDDDSAPLAADARRWLISAGRDAQWQCATASLDAHPPCDATLNETWFDELRALGHPDMLDAAPL